MCNAITKKGTQCSFKGIYNGYCKKHRVAEKEPIQFKYETVHKAAENGDLEEVIKMYTNGHKINTLTTKAAAKSQSLDLLMYLHSKGCSFSQEPVIIYTVNGNLECLSYCIESHIDYPWDLFHLAVEHNHIHIVEYLYQLGLEPIYNGKTLISIACQYNHLEMIKVLQAHGNTISNSDFYACCLYGRLEILKYIRQFETTHWRSIYTIVAAEHGKLNILQYAHENGLEFYHLICELASEYGHLECLKYLHKSGFPLGRSASRALRNSELNTFQYALENGSHISAGMFKRLNNRHFRFVLNLDDPHVRNFWFNFNYKNFGFKGKLKDYINLKKLEYETKIKVSNETVGETVCQDVMVNILHQYF
jgi:Family of unknown function (DUF5763)/Ankyrin repeats (3 copies)